MSKGRNWIATLNNPDVTPPEYLEAYMTTHRATYVVGQLEKGEEGTAHLQFFVNFGDNRRLSAMKKIEPRAHWEVARDP